MYHQKLLPPSTRKSFHMMSSFAVEHHNMLRDQIKAVEFVLTYIFLLSRLTIWTTAGVSQVFFALRQCLAADNEPFIYRRELKYRQIR